MGIKKPVRPGSMQIFGAGIWRHDNRKTTTQRLHLNHCPALDDRRQDKYIAGQHQLAHRAVGPLRHVPKSRILPLIKLQAEVVASQERPIRRRIDRDPSSLQTGLPNLCVVSSSQQIKLSVATYFCSAGSANTGGHPYSATMEAVPGGSDRCNLPTWTNHHLRQFQFH